MKIYNSLIIGSGYCAVGYAAACPNSVICEEQQVCDTQFYLPLVRYRHQPYLPKTEEGSRLLSKFVELSLFENGMQNTNGFEFALCRYLVEKEIEVLLKCRVIRVFRREDLLYDVTVHTNEGLSHLIAKKIIDTRNRAGKKYYTVLFICNDLQAVQDKLLSMYKGSCIEPAFYQGRYALHIPVATADENRIKLEIYQKWGALDVDAKILYMAPVFYKGTSADLLCDGHYENPIEAFEAGYLCAKEENR